MFKSFSDFISFLDKEIDWNSNNYEDYKTVEAALKNVLANKYILQERIEEIYSNNELLNFFQPHIEFRPLMDKFPIYFDPEDNFRIRVNHFKSKLLNKGARPETPHDHRFPFSTIILAGSYTECSYEQNNVNEDDCTADLKLLECKKFSVGDTHSLTSEVIHNVFNESADQPCISLFVRGKSFRDYSNVFQPEVGKFFRSYGLKKELKRELSLINQYVEEASYVK